MVESLLIYTLKEDGTSVSFPPKDIQPALAYSEQARIADYTFTVGRMGSANIQATLMYPICLDNIWTGREYVEFRGARHWIFTTPTSSKDNTDIRYKHELNFTPDRIALDNTYFFDVVSPNASDVDKFVSNSTKFTLYGDISEFVKRMNYSLEYSKLGFTCVLDPDITSEEKMISFENKFFSEVLQEVFNVYELPYYFVGKEIHIGFTSNAITYPFRYGYDKELLSITKTNANYKVVNRCTGIGSEENIPYYYPNDTKKTTVGVEADSNNASIKQEDISIIDEDKFKEQVSVNEEVVYKNFTEDNVQTEPGVVTLWCDSGYQYKYELNKRVELEKIPNEGRWSSYLYISISPKQTATYDFTLETYWLTQSNPREGRPFLVDAKISDEPRRWELIEKGGNRIRFSLKKNTLTADLEAGKEYLISVWFYYSTTPDKYYSDTILYYNVGRVRLSYTQDVWTLKDTPIPLERIGISVSKEPTIGDKFKQIKIDKDYMITSPNLVPPIYRETFGEERFYNAKNNTYINPDTGEYYVFENEYVEGNPKEMIVSFDYIKPSIKNIKNAAGELIGEILDVAFDDDDNDEIDTKNNKYEHEFFYVKLRRFDGEYGFNLFEQGIAQDSMTISMKNGYCSACNFEVGIVKDKSNPNIFYNPVQIDSNGDIVAGNYDEKVVETNIIQRQQNTKTNEVWIALKKDVDTFGVVMPSNIRNYKPASGDSFVITNISLPQSYIYSAENELKEAIIKYMVANNSEKFNFSINFKRIFFAEHPEILDLLDENARLIIEYNGNKYTQYVSNYTYKVKSNEILPEITVELSETITIRKGSLQTSIDAVKQDIMSSVGSIDFLKMGLKYFIRKDVDDSADGHIIFRKGIYVTGPDNYPLLQEGSVNAIQEGSVNAIQEYTKEIKDGGGGGDCSCIIDDHLDLESTNAVQNKVVTENINELMEEVFKLTFSSFVGGGTYEKGQSITPTISWSISRKGVEVIPNAATVNGSSANVTANRKAWTSPTPIETNQTYSVVCRYGVQSVSKSASFIFSIKKYWGVSDKTDLTNEDVLSLSSAWAQRAQATTAFDCTGGKYPYYIIPTSMASGIQFWIGGLRNTDWVENTKNIINKYGYSESYTIFRLNNIQTGVLNIEVR